MQFGLMVYAEIRPGHPDSFPLLRAEVTAAEAAGFDFGALIEHHQGEHGEFSSPLVWLSALAAATSSIRLGTAVALLPLYHPVRLAEELATVDVISGGRLFLGAGLGYQEKDFAAFAVPMAERRDRFTEALHILRALWPGAPVTCTGRHWALANVRLAPRPLQPVLPVWGGAMAPAAVRRVAAVCDAWIAPSNLRPTQLAPLVQAYREAAAAAGRPARIILSRNAWVADSVAEARAVYGPAILGHYQALSRTGGSQAALGELHQALPTDTAGDHPFILGRPEDCVRQINAYRRELGIDGLLLRLRTPHGPEHALVREAIGRFGREVIPHYR